LIGHLIDAEWEDRYNRKLVRSLKTANFRYKASIEDITFTRQRNLDKNMILRLSNCGYINKAENILITGPTGVGKSFIACALGNQAVINGLKVIYSNCIKLFPRLKYAKAEGTYVKELKKLQKQHLIVLDDFGLHPLDEQSKLILLELLEDRYADKSMIITSQFPVAKWYDIIENSTVADAICDSFIHNAHQIQLKGDSMRKKIKTYSG